MSKDTEWTKGDNGEGEDQRWSLWGVLLGEDVCLGDFYTEATVDRIIADHGAQQALARAEAQLKRCGGDNCMGLEVDGVARWVRAERLEAAEAQVAYAIDRLGAIGTMSAWTDSTLEDAGDEARSAVKHLKQLAALAPTAERAE